MGIWLVDPKAIVVPLSLLLGLEHGMSTPSTIEKIRRCHRNVTDEAPRGVTTRFLDIAM